MLWYIEGSDRRVRDPDGRMDIPSYHGARDSKWRILCLVAKRTAKSSRARTVAAQALVSVVDDDESVRESLPDLLKELGFSARAFTSADEFLTSDCVAATRCLILDVAMPRMSGPALQRELTLRGHAIRIIFITARGDESLRRQLIARGAVGCLFKPFSEQELKSALDMALPER
jgi:FixJ family two-component response regulator